MKIRSTSFKNNGNIPSEYGCSGDNISPEIYWEDYPKETRSFALICRDPDSPSNDFVHWIIVNIPMNITHIPKGAMMIDSAQNIVNDFGRKEYGGPCPPSGTHRYIFQIYALNIEKIENIDKNNFNDKISVYIIDQAQLIGLYKKREIYD